MYPHDNVDTKLTPQHSRQKKSTRGEGREGASPLHQLVVSGEGGWGGPYSVATCPYINSDPNFPKVKGR